jgi:hypothetical protein
MSCTIHCNEYKSKFDTALQNLCTLVKAAACKGTVNVIRVVQHTWELWVNILNLRPSSVPILGMVGRQHVWHAPPPNKVAHFLLFIQRCMVMVMHIVTAKDCAWTARMIQLELCAAMQVSWLLPYCI